MNMSSARVLLVWAILQFVLTVCRAYLDIYIPDFGNRVFTNVSLGLEADLARHGHQCSPEDGKKRAVGAHGDSLSMTYTPNRRRQEDTLHDAHLQKLQLAFVVALGGHRMGGYNYGASGSINGLGAVWDSWTDHFMTHTSNTTSLIFLLDERDFLAQNDTRDKTRYLDSIFVDNLGLKPVDCAIQRAPRAHASSGSGSSRGGTGRDSKRAMPGNHNHNHNRPHGGAHADDKTSTHTRPAACSTHLLELDAGYKVYYLDVASSKYSLGKASEPFIVFASVYAFPKPRWAEHEDEDTLDIHWRPFRLPKRFNTNYAYTKLTNWYSHHMMSLRLLDYFDYGGKIDNDVSFLQGFPEPNLALRMAKQGSMALGTQKEWYYDDARVSRGVRECLFNFMEEESNKCTAPPKVALHAAGRNDPTFWHTSSLNCTFRSHFMTFWLGLYASPEVRTLAKHWGEWHPHGMWDYRWGDQQWWPRPIAMFTNVSIGVTIDKYLLIDSDNDKYVKHKEYPRSATLRDFAYVNMTAPLSRKEREAGYAAASMKKAQWNSAEAILLTAKLERTAESASQMNDMLQSYIVGAIHQISF